MKTDPSYRKLYVTSKMEVGHIYEDAYLTNNRGNSTLIGSFHGDPTCALIDVNNKWCLIGGDKLHVWHSGKITVIGKETLQYIHALRQTSQDVVEILTDPWSDFSAIWQIQMDTLAIKKIRDFEEYKNKAYSNEISW